MLTGIMLVAAAAAYWMFKGKARGNQTKTFSLAAERLGQRAGQPHSLSNAPNDDATLSANPLSPPGRVS